MTFKFRKTKIKLRRIVKTRSLLTCRYMLEKGTQDEE